MSVRVRGALARGAAPAPGAGGAMRVRAACASCARNRSWSNYGARVLRCARCVPWSQRDASRLSCAATPPLTRLSKMRAARMLPVGACLSRCLCACRSACMRCMPMRGCECEWPGLLTSARQAWRWDLQAAQRRFVFIMHRAHTCARMCHLTSCACAYICAAGGEEGLMLDLYAVVFLGQGVLQITERERERERERK